MKEQKNKIQKHRDWLIGLGIALMVLCFAGIIGGIFVIAGGIGSIASQNLATGIIFVILGALLIFACLAGFAVSFIFLVLGKSVKAVKGSIAEGNLGKGTENMKKCSKCGNEITDEMEYCKNCGHDTKTKKVCEACNAENDADSKVCVCCGKEFE